MKIHSTGRILNSKNFEMHFDVVRARMVKIFDDFISQK